MNIVLLLLTSAWTIKALSRKGPGAETFPGRPPHWSIKSTNRTKKRSLAWLRLLFCQGDSELYFSSRKIERKKWEKYISWDSFDTWQVSRKETTPAMYLIQSWISYLLRGNGWQKAISLNEAKNPTHVTFRESQQFRDWPVFPRQGTGAVPLQGVLGFVAWGGITMCSGLPVCGLQQEPKNESIPFRNLKRGVVLKIQNLSSHPTPIESEALVVPR